MSVTFYDVESTVDEALVGGVVDHGNGTVNITTAQNGLSIVPSSEINTYRQGYLRQEIDVHYTPNSNFYGSDVIKISATDTEGGSVEKAINIIVTYINDPPHFGVTEVKTEEDTPLVIVLPDDLDVIDPEDILHAGSFSIIKSPQYGSLQYNITNNTGTLTYIPNENYFTTDDKPEYFILQACDNDTVVPDNKLCTNATITVSVVSTNDPPVVPVYTVEIDEEKTYTVNLIAMIFDVEDVTPPVGNVSIIEPFVRNGSASYDKSTGYITYEPSKDFYGVDYIHFQSCDQVSSCNSSGLITINVLDVNDPPIAVDFTMVAREDIFELFDVHMYASDLEDEAENLKISIVDQSTGNYMSDDEVILPSGASLRVYQQHGIVTYEPSPDFVGYDSFTYAICDTCDVRRNQELGRTSLEEYPQCSKQLEENGGNRNKPGEDVDITCDEASVSVIVINTDDTPLVKDLSGRTFANKSLVINPLVDSRIEYSPNRFFYSDASYDVYDPDDKQAVNALTNNLNLTLFGLRDTTDVDPSSLTVSGDANLEGQVSINLTSDGIPYILYTPNGDFSGYETFNYQLCDIQNDDNPPRCSQAMIRIFVTKDGPEIVSVTAVSNMENGYHSNSKVSKGDKIVIQFSEDTNMPPHNSLDTTVSADEIDAIFEFPQGFIPPPLYANRYVGVWTSRDQFEITIVNEGYPQPENKIGEWTVRIKDIDSSLCGGINEFGIQTVPNKNCLLTSDTFSAHSSAVSPPIEGNWGLRLPDLTTVVVSTDSRSSTSSSTQLLFPQSQISLYLSESFSHNQLVLYCSQDPSHILVPSVIGTDVSMTITGCENLLVNGEDAFTRYTNEIERSREYFDVLDFARTKRQIDLGITEQPVVSKVVLRLNSFTRLTLSSLNDIQDGLNRTTMAEVVSELSGVNASLFMTYYNDLPADVRPVVQPYQEHQDGSTPKVITITGDDPDCLHTGYGVGDTITIEFDRDTDQPAITTKSDIDKIFVFDTIISEDYTGYWETPSKAVIRIGSTGYSPPDRLSFTSNYLSNGTIFNESNANLPTDKLHCYGVNVCGTGGPTIGVCDSSQLSCRAHEPIRIGTLEFNGGNRCSAAVSSINNWLWSLLAVFAAIFLVLFLILAIYYCYRKNKRKRQKEEAMRVVERWRPTKDNERKDSSATLPWAKPPDILAMRDQPDPFKDTGPLRNLPEMIKRPPTAAAAENLPPIDSIPTTFVPRAGARIVPTLPTLLPLPLQDNARRMSRDNSLPSLTPLGLPRINTRTSIPSLSPTEQKPVLGPLRGPLHLYAQRASDTGLPSPSGPSASSLPGVLRPATLPPIQATAGQGEPPVLRRLSNFQPPPLPQIPKTSGPAFVNRVTPITSSDENITSTSDVDTEGATSTSDGGRRRPLVRQLTGPLPRNKLPSRPSIGTIPPPLSPPAVGQPGRVLGRQGSVPTMMPLRRTSVDPFPPQLTSPTNTAGRGLSRLPSLTPTGQPPSVPLPGPLGIAPGTSLRALPLPTIPPIKEDKKETEEN